MIRLRALALVALLPTVSAAQQIGQLPRVTPTTGLADSALFMCTDSTKAVTRACKFSLVQQRLAFKPWDSLVTTSKLRITGASIVGAGTWANLQTFAAGQLVDSATGSARAQVLTTARTIGGVSFNGSANIIPDTATGVVRAQTLTTARALWGQSFNGSAAITGSLTSVGDITGGASSMNILAGTGASRRLVLQTTTSGSTATTAVRFNEVQQALFSSGTSSRPAMAFASDTTTGLSLTAGSILKLNAAGVTFVQVDGGNSLVSVTSGSFRIPSGSALFPGLSWGSSTGTGLFLNNVDTLGLSSAGALSLGIRGGASPTLFGGAGNMTIQAGTGNSRTMTLQTTTSGGTATSALLLNASQQVVASQVGTAALPAFTFTGNLDAGIWSSGGSSVDIAAGGTNIVDIGSSSFTSNRRGSFTTLDAQPGGKDSVFALLRAIYRGSFLVWNDSLTRTTHLANYATGSLNKTFLTADTNQAVGFPGQARFANGAVGTPGISFASDSLLGLYRVGTAGASDTIMVSANGVNQMKIAPAGILRLPLLPSEGSTKNAMCWDGTTFNVTQNAAATCTVSSARFKENIVPLSVSSAWNIVGKSQLHSSTYNERVGGRKAIGIIAEQADSADTRLASRDGKGLITSTNYEEVTALLLTIVKDQQRQLDSIKTVLKTITAPCKGSDCILVRKP